MDIIRELGSMAFASRLKRISEQLMKDVSRLYRELDVDFQARWFPVLYILTQTSPMSVTEIARALRMTHPAINQIASGMARAELLISTKNKADERKRMLSLTAKGGRLSASMVPIWRDIDAATRDVIDNTGMDLLTALDRIEEALGENDMYRRVIARIKKRQFDAVEIVEYAPKYKKRFRELNYEWLQEYFTVEEHDEAVLSDPFGMIIEPGGNILFARIGGEIVGTVALIKHDDATFQLTKLAVTEKARGRQTGKRLACAAVYFARNSGAAEIILYTSPVLKAANNLYRKLGFVESTEIPPPTYHQRPTITMKLKLSE